jgi:hypothetical protein
MKINQIISETTTAGSIAPVSHSFTKMETRNPSVYGDTKAGSLLKGKKTKKPFANSISEGTEERKRNRQMAQATDYETRAKQTTNDIKKQHYLKMAADIRRGIKTSEEEPVAEAKLDEDDIIMIPGQGQRLKPGFHKHDPDKAEHEGETLKNSLHTIIRVATHLNRELSTRDNFPEWVSEKVGAIKSNMVNVMDYLISQQEMGQDTDGMYEGAKVDRMVKHIEKSEKKLGHTKKEAENIAWATANKRGMLDNKNKKK